jgi:PPOX class probable F420-dependent enzyme
VSNPQTRVVPEHFEDLLYSPALAHVATIGPDGEPQNTPIWFEWDGEHLRFAQTSMRQKLRNLERDPRASFSIVDPVNPYRYLEVRVRLVRVDPDPDCVFINRMAKKYLGRDVYPWLDSQPEWDVLTFEPIRTTQMEIAEIP